MGLTSPSVQATQQMDGRRFTVTRSNATWDSDQQPYDSGSNTTPLGVSSAITLTPSGRINTPQRPRTTTPQPLARDDQPRLPRDNRMPWGGF